MNKYERFKNFNNLPSPSLRFPPWFPMCNCEFDKMAEKGFHENCRFGFEASWSQVSQLDSEDRKLERSSTAN